MSAAEKEPTGNRYLDEDATAETCAEDYAGGDMTRWYMEGHWAHERQHAALPPRTKGK